MQKLQVVKINCGICNDVPRGLSQWGKRSWNGSICHCSGATT